MCAEGCRTARLAPVGLGLLAAGLAIAAAASWAGADPETAAGAAPARASAVGETPPAEAARKEAESEEIVPLGEDLPDDEPVWSADSRLVYGESVDSARAPSRRLHLDFAHGGLTLRGHAAARDSLETRCGARWRGGAWSLAAGRLGGRLGAGLILGARRRSGLGRVRGPSSESADLRPSTSSSPLLEGAAVSGRLSGLSLRAAYLKAGGEALSGALLGLGRGGAELLLFQSGETRAASMNFSAGDEAASLELALGLGRRSAAPVRGALLWRARARPGALAAGIEMLLLSGPALANPHLTGWFSAASGGELHGFVSGESGAWRWRLARRRRAGIGLADGARRTETGLELSTPWRGGRLSLLARFIETFEFEPVSQAPGIPRALEARALRRELVLDWRASWRLRAVWRQAEQAPPATLLSVESPRSFVKLKLSLFDAPAGNASFLFFDGAGVLRRVEALSESGWRLGASSRWHWKRLSLRPGASWTRRRAGEDRFALWFETQLGG